MSSRKNVFSPSNVWKHWKPSSTKLSLSPWLGWQHSKSYCMENWPSLCVSADTPWSRGNLRLFGRRQFISLASTDPSPLLQSFHFTSESKVGLTMEHSPSLPFFFFFSCQSEKWLGGSSNYVEHAGTVFMPKKIGVTTVLEADEVMLWWPEKGAGVGSAVAIKPSVYTVFYHFKGNLHILFHFNLVQFGTLDLITIIICSHFSN